ncbi:hypothetical protein [Pseudomonas tohonis]|uniref:hypothetical protein n=1 Tax=Pseudomonas tohonis TaxID=2725477 RepID=UPI0021D85953|nr:hypothetical protein [Pseudomonas tohonis]UXY50779.1 hypothetical protein N9L84_17555 [Pseudomonas tohonis]
MSDLIKLGEGIGRVLCCFFCVLLLSALEGCSSIGDRVVYIEGQFASVLESGGDCFLEFSSGFRKYSPERVLGRFEISYIVVPDEKAAIYAFCVSDKEYFRRSYFLQLGEVGEENVYLGIIE